MTPDPDDLMPNDGTHFNFMAEPEEQIIERQKEKAKTLEALPILEELIDRLAERAEYYEKTTSIPDAVRTKSDEFMALHSAYALMSRTMAEEKEYIEGLVEEAMGRKR